MLSDQITLVSQINPLYLQIMVVFQKNLVYQTEKPTLSEINLRYLIIVTTACHIPLVIRSSRYRDYLLLSRLQFC